MAKLLLLSIILGTIAVPVRAARQKNPQLGLKKALTGLAILNVCYLLAVWFVWPRL
jgi:hypothetical protein